MRMHLFDPNDYATNIHIGRPLERWFSLWINYHLRQHDVWYLAQVIDHLFSIEPNSRDDSEKKGTRINFSLLHCKNHEKKLTSGFGLPLPSHGNSIVVPSCTSISNGSLINFGFSGCSAFPQINLPGQRDEEKKLVENKTISMAVRKIQKHTQ